LFHNVIQTFIDVYKNHGIGGLYVGFFTRFLMKVAPACGIMVSTYEFGITIL
jgi:hypothetical protein